MLTLDKRKPAAGAHKGFKVIGRGRGSGRGKTSGKGHKGQNARTGGGVRLGFEGGQMPLARRSPKRGFKSPFKVQWELISVLELNDFPANSEVNPQLLREQGYIKANKLPVKVLGDGNLEKCLFVKAQRFSKSAQEKIEKAGGKIEVVARG
jgi:large subunit ribosomal protein L15